MEAVQQIRPAVHGLRKNNGTDSGVSATITNPVLRVLVFYTGFILVGITAFTIFPVLDGKALSPLDALFTAVSAVTLTGLATVSLSEFSPEGQMIVLSLIQAGGIGLLYFASRLIIVPGCASSKSHHLMVRERWSEVNELTPKNLLRNIILGVLFLEFLGTMVLYFLLKDHAVEFPFLSSLFHAVSALLNASFTTFGTGNLEILTQAPIAGTLGVLILLGGLGYVVLAEILHKIRDKNRQWSLNVPISLIGTLVIITLGTSLYLLIDRNSSTGFWTALMRTINARTAGFSIVDPAQSTAVARILSMLLMFIGGAAGSVTGGIKITALIMLFMTALKGYGTDRRIVLFRRRIPVAAQSSAVLFFLRVAGMMISLILLLSLAETVFNPSSDFSFGDLVFEAVSAFTTAGLSTGITSLLSAAGKFVIIAAMLTGRIGLLLMISKMGNGTRKKPEKSNHTIYPEGEVLLG